jgi:nucleoside-diphosphate-sugar epimerase
MPQFGGNLANVEDLEAKLQIRISDVRDQKIMDDLVKGKDFLFNLVGQTSHLDSMTDPLVDLEINSKSQLSILEAVRTHNPALRIVFSSTRQIYGKPKYLPVDEMHPIAPVDVNGINKYAGECYHLLYNRVYGIPCTALRLTNTYGPGMRVKDSRQTFLGIWMKNLLKGDPIEVFGDGLQLRDFNFVEDVVDALLLAALSKSSVGRVMNLGSREVIDLKSLAEKIVSIHGEGVSKLIPFPADRKAIDIGDYFSDFALAQATLGWEPKIGLDAGLSRTLDFYRARGDKYWN